VLLIAAGAAPDLRLVPAQIIGHGCRFVLNDYDQTALDLAQDLLGPVARYCTFIPGNVLRAIPALTAQGPYDLVPAGGLFDYLPDRATRFVIDRPQIVTIRHSGPFVLVKPHQAAVLAASPSPIQARSDRAALRWQRSAESDRG
jgi:hypothetical protein